jgi:hypothetical protein
MMNQARRPDPRTPHETPSESDAPASAEPLSPKQAEAVIARVRAEHGLGERYLREVWLRGDGHWLVVDREGHRVRVAPMSEAALRSWLVHEHFVEAIAEHDATTEG